MFPIVNSTVTKKLNNLPFRDAEVLIEDMLRRRILAYMPEGVINLRYSVKQLWQRDYLPANGVGLIGIAE